MLSVPQKRGTVGDHDSEEQVKADVHKLEAELEQNIRTQKSTKSRPRVHQKHVEDQNHLRNVLKASWCSRSALSAVTSGISSEEADLRQLRRGFISGPSFRR